MTGGLGKAEWGAGSKMVTVDHDETRTRNLLIRSQTPYPLGHAVHAQKGGRRCDNTCSAHAS